MSIQASRLISVLAIAKQSPVIAGLRSIKKIIYSSSYDGSF